MMDPNQHHSSSDLHFEEASAVSAEPIAESTITDCTHDDLPMIELASTAAEDMMAGDVNIAQIRHEDHLPLTATAIAIAELVTTAFITIPKDIETGRFLGRRVWGSSRAEFISATFIKTEAGTPLGFNLSTKEPRIASIREGSLASSSPLRVGDKLVSINKKQCSTMDSISISKLLLSLSGQVEIVVHNKGGSPHFVESMVTKSSQRERSGLVLKRGAIDGILKVSAIREGHVFVHSLINVGDELLTINSIPCDHLTPAEAANIIKETPKNVTVVARTLRDTGMVVAELASVAGGSQIGGGSTHNGNNTSQLRPSAVAFSPPQLSNRQQIFCAAIGLISLVVVAVIIFSSASNSNDIMYTDDHPYPWHDHNSNNNNNTAAALSSSYGSSYGCWDGDCREP